MWGKRISWKLNNSRWKISREELGSQKNLKKIKKSTTKSLISLTPILADFITKETTSVFAIIHFPQFDGNMPTTYGLYTNWYSTFQQDVYIVRKSFFER
jgi:hypothetical protein